MSLDKNYYIFWCILLPVFAQADWKYDLQAHDAYWSQHGEKSFFDNQRYDGNTNRREYLLNGLRKENPQAAQAFEGKGLPDVICFELEKHIDYKQKNGFKFEGQMYDDNWERARSLFRQCQAKNPERAAFLEKKMLTPSALAEFKQHIQYWNERGNIDWDPLTFVRKYNNARDIDPVKADEIALLAPPNLFQHISSFTTDLAQGKIPAVFKLHGTLSGPIKDVNNQLASGLAEVKKITPQFADMYFQLGSKKWELNEAFKALETGKQALAAARKEVSSNAFITKEIKDPLIKGFTSFENALPEIERILSSLYKEINELDPTTSPKTAASEKEFIASVNAAAQKQAEKVIGVQVNGVLEAAHRKYGGVDILQSLSYLSTNLAQRNL